MSDKLKGIRTKIDAIDAAVVRLLGRRARLAQEIGRNKPPGTAYRPEREAQVLRRVAGLERGPMPAAALGRIYTEIMSACRSLEDTLHVAYLGPRGTFSEEAYLRHFGASSTGVPCASIDEVFRKVESGGANYGVVPVENSTEGAVGRSLDLLLSTPLTICGEVLVQVHQCLMSRSGRREAIRRIYSHSQSLAQCHGWLGQHLAGVERTAVVSNAEAARLASRDPASAAVAGKMAAALYKLKVIARNIEDVPNNTTRFVTIGKLAPGPSGKDRTSLVLSTRNRPGAVHELLTPFARHGVSMTRLESRPARSGMWEYVFFIDIVGHRDDIAVARALTQVERRATLFKVLGSYPAAAT